MKCHLSSKKFYNYWGIGPILSIIDKGISTRGTRHILGTPDNLSGYKRYLILRLG